jgi:Ca2+/H+ antiporter, TMEM165/GDT1 family
VTTAYLLTVVGAGLACLLEMLEALAIVLAVAVTRRPRDAVIGALAGVVGCALLAAVAGPLLVDQAAERPLRLIAGIALLLFGLEWLRKAVLRLAGRRSPSSAYREFVEEQEKLESAPLPAFGRSDWAARTVTFKGVLLEGFEVILIVTALAARPSARAAALLGAGVALVVTVAIGALLHRPLRRLPESAMKYAVGLLLTSFGTFFTGSGLGVPWPLGEGTLIVLLGAYLATSQGMVAVLAQTPSIAVKEASV